MIKDIIDNNITYARIIRAAHDSNNCEFYTRIEDELQIGTIVYDEKYKTGTHYHNRPEGFINETDEILMIQDGSARIDLYNIKGVYIKSCEVFKGDIVILYMGGHNITYYEKTKIFIIKKGPYNAQIDTTRIVGANNLEIVIDN